MLKSLRWYKLQIPETLPISSVITKGDSHCYLSQKCVPGITATIWVTSKQETPRIRESNRSDIISRTRYGMCAAAVSILLQLMASTSVKESAATIITPSSKMKPIWEKLNSIYIIIVAMKGAYTRGGSCVPEFCSHVTWAWHKHLWVACTDWHTATKKNSTQRHQSVFFSLGVIKCA